MYAFLLCWDREERAANSSGDACWEGINPLWAQRCFLEYESLLARDELFETCQLDHEEREALLNAFLSVCTWQTIYYIWRPNLPDEADNHLVELAVAGRAEAIVTWNTQDFQRAELRFPGLRIVRPNDFLEEDSEDDNPDDSLA